MIARQHLRTKLAILTAAFAFAAALLAAAPASAANYTFTGNVPVTLTGSGITVSVLSGSKADSFTIGSTTLLVTVLSGDTFTLRYAGPSPGTLANNGAIADCTLNGSDNEATVTGPATVTFTPNTTVCVSTSGGGGAAAAAAAESNKPLAVSVVSPNGGEFVQAGSTRTIMWNKQGGEFHYVTVQLSTNGGDSYPFTLANAVGDTGYLSWLVASDIPSTNLAKIRVQFIVLGSVKVSDVSDANFSIVGASATPVTTTGTTITGPVPLPSALGTTTGASPTTGAPGTATGANGTSPTTGTPGSATGESSGSATSAEDTGLQPPAVPLTSLPKPGEASPAAEALKSFLTANGFPAGVGSTFDGAAQAALIQFQIEHSDSGELGVDTLRFINDLYRRKSAACRRSFFGLIPPIRPLTRTLATGDVHPDVAVLQKFLNDNGFILAARGAGSPGNESENFRSLTVRALSRFQAKYGLLSEKGSLGPKNAFFLEGLSENPSIFQCPTLVPPISRLARDLRQGARGADVRVLQVFLNANGFSLASSGSGARGQETTSFLALTRVALSRFQAQHSLAAENGVMGPLTRAFVNALIR